jgi:hypothetical protein
MRRLSAFLAIFALVPSLALAAEAAAPMMTPPVEAKLVTGSTDQEAIANCLAESADSPYACIGSIAVVCARLASSRGDDPSLTCAEREEAIWRSRLDTAVAELRRSLPASAFHRFNTLQQAWQNYYALKCSFLGDEGGTRAERRKNGCELREVAMRAIEVDRYLRRQKKQRS